tara:strand:+ start:2161 stop:2553 length:393 start_codon:yes stop_codon:yes gene_type:complete
LKIHISKNYHLDKLKKWLELELSGSILLFLSYAFGITIFLAILVAVLFLPLLFKVLIKERRYGWILFFVIFVIGSGVLSYYFFGQATWLDPFTNNATAVLVSLGFFYFYCATLRLVIPEWYHEEEDNHPI